MNLKSNFVKNSGFNIVGQIIPLFIGLYSIPKIISNFGVERFGLLTIVWIILGYFSLFDFGMGKTTTAFISKSIAKNERHQIAGQFWSSIFLIAIFSIIGVILVFVLSMLRIDHFTKISPNLVDEIQGCYYGVALGIPFVTLLVCLKGLLETTHAFLEINILQILLGAFTYFSPLLIMKYSTRLDHLVFLLVFGRFIFVLIHFYFCFKYFPEIKKIKLAPKDTLRNIFTFGGWLTVSNIVGPLMLYCDRFILGSIIPAKQIGFYTAPYEISSKMTIIPTSVTRVLFPSLNQEMEFSNKSKLYKKALLLTSIMMGILCLSVISLSYWILKLWLGEEFAKNSSILLNIFCVGSFFNSIGGFPFTWIHSHGRADLTAKIHLIELPIYFILLYFLSVKWGLIGAAITWTIRMALDAALLFYMKKRLNH